MKNYIKHAYALEKANRFFSQFTKDDILNLYTQLDCVYDLLESLDVVSIYSKNEILKDFEITTDMGNNNYITVDEKSKQIPINAIVNELTKVFIDI